jgi:7-carboxy-7-deazaguanine synthase
MLKTENKYYVSEIFESIQGEGNYAGVYALFIRFHFCNLTCSWCDTKYTWNVKSGEFKEYTEEELREIVKSSIPYHIIFTGGEPALYRIDKLAVKGKRFHVETNATIIPDEKISIKFNDKMYIEREALDENIFKTFNWVVSPKLTNSKQIINEKAINYWSSVQFPVFKFIVQSVHDLNEVEQFTEKYKIARQKVYIGLEGVTIESQIRPDLVDEIIKRGFNFSPRLQILLWGNKRGR